MRNILLLTALLTTFAASAPVSAPRSTSSSTIGSSPSGGSRSALDTATVRRLYLDGDFDQAISMLEKSIKEKRPFNHGDSVFIFKHLGVMYAAKYDTREKGKYYMHQLLLVEPTARIMDMYASDMIYMIFKNIQDEFEATRMKLTRAETHVIGNKSGPDTTRREQSRRPGPTAKQPAKKSNAGLWWGATGAVVLTGVGVATYFLMEEEPAGKKVVIPID